MKKDLEEGKPTCIKCKKAMEPVQIKLGTINARHGNAVNVGRKYCIRWTQKRRC